jgi:hypothetical protein
LLEHGSTRFLSFGPSIDKILRKLDGLSSRFLSQETFPAMLRKLFEDLCLKLWLSSARYQVSTFRTYISLLEKDNRSSTEVAMNTENLVNNLDSRKNEVFVIPDVENN